MTTTMPKAGDIRDGISCLTSLFKGLCCHSVHDHAAPGLFRDSNLFVGYLPVFRFQPAGQL
jgi:hypothetical protein